MFGRKMVKRAVGCLLAFTMAVTGFPLGNAAVKNNSNIAYADEVLTENDVELKTEEMVNEEKTVQAENDSVRYIAAGGSTPVPWDTGAEENELIKSDLEGVYTLTFTMPAYDENTEWINRFKILRQDEELCNGWSEQLCLGTTVYADTQSNIRVENTEETEITIYFHPLTGALVILDEQGNNIDYTFSWVGSENEVEYFTASEFSDCGFAWPEEYVHVDVLPDIQAKNNALLDYIQNGTPIEIPEEPTEPDEPIDPDEPDMPQDGNRVRFHFQNGGNWDEVGGYIYQGIAWTTNATDNSVVTVKKSNGEVKKLWPGARCIEERENWYTCTATFTDSVLTDGMVFIFNNLVGDSEVNVTMDEEDVNAILASGIKTTLDSESLQTPSVIISKRNSILSDGTIPTDLYITYDGVMTNVTDTPPDSYLNAKLPPNKYVDGILYNPIINELIAYPTDRKGEFVIPDMVTVLRDYAFEDSKGLTKIIIPKNANFDVCYEKDGEFAGRIFSGCDNLQAIYVDEQNVNYKSLDGLLYSADGKNLLVFPNGKTTDYSIPEGTESIEKYSFWNCKYLVKVTIPESVTRIDEHAFEGCDRFTIYGTAGTVAEEYANAHNIPFVNIEESEHVPDKSDKYIDGVLYNWDETELIRYPVDKAGSFKVPETVRIIRDGAFWNCEELTEIIIPENTMFNLYADGVKGKENVMFKGCDKLRAIDINKNHPDYKTVDGVLFDKTGKELLFYPTSKENEYTIPGIVEYMENYIFADHENMKIYGMDGSYAKTYAKENGIEFMQLGEILSSDNTSSSDSVASVLCSEKQIDTDVSLNVSDIKEEEIAIEDKIKHPNVSKDDVKYKAYDINLTDKENNKVQPNGTIVVKIKCPEEFNGVDCRIYYIDENGKVMDMDAYYQEGYLYFHTNHFSTYLITETELITNEDGISDVLLGDANGDGKTDLKDSAIIKRYLAGWDVEINMTAADMDEDGKVTIKDSALIKRQLAG